METTTSANQSRRLIAHVMNQDFGGRQFVDFLFITLAIRVLFLFIGVLNVLIPATVSATVHLAFLLFESKNIV